MLMTYLHVDMDAFFASVEQHDHPELRGQPVVIGAQPDQRGVVAAASYEAREYGIHSAMPSREAGERCPHAVFLPPNGKRYGEVSRQIMGIFERFTPYVEQLSVDEAFLDVTGAQRLLGTGREIAAKIKDTVKGETGLTASVGVAVNKFLAKLASDMDKPDGLTVVPNSKQEIITFLAPLPVGRIWGVGKVTQNLLESKGIRTVGDLQETPERLLSALVGKHSARHLHRLAFGEDEREIETEREEKSISKEHTFLHDTSDREAVRHTLLGLVDDVGRRLRESGKLAGVARLKIRWKGFKTITRQRTLNHPCRDDFSLREIATELFMTEELVKPVRLIGFGVSGLTDRASRQLGLFDDISDRSKREQLSRAVDDIRREHGSKSIGRGSGASQ
ncbi:MAG: DNA polymerase IV [Kiritimatiellia bacterium]|jgi:DNA polymerase-4|nr:DNA polymerase IV [Kiritimatiellia bacterium]